MDSKFSDSFTFLPQGAIIQEFKVNGKNIVLGFPSASSYRTVTHQHFGETIGRVANRIAGANIELNGKSYTLNANSGANTLHGGIEGWGKKIFEGPTPVQRNSRDAVMFKYLSEDGEEGFPGAVELRLWYYPSLEFDAGVEKTTLEIEYGVELVSDDVEETVVSLANHSYFNIGDKATIEGTYATIYTDIHQVKDHSNIPTGELGQFPDIVAGEEFNLGAITPAIDHTFVMDTDPSSIPLDTRQRLIKKLCEFRHPDTKLRLEALSTEPAFQFYTGEYVNVAAVDRMPARGPRSGLCVEASRYANAINNRDWRQMVLLKRGLIYGSRTIYRAWVED